jgi:GNAT superfamily N-acetyltransferase
MSAPIAVIRADLSHVPVIAPLFDAYRQFYKQAPDLEGARAFVTDRIAKGESVIFLALGTGEFYGFTQLYPLFSSVRLGRAWLLNDLYVAPSARRKGVGEALLARARQFAEESGAGSLMLETAVDNVPAQQLYERMGWVRETEFYTYNLYL